jgi:hypothetical protein
MTCAELHANFVEDGMADMYTWYMRLLTSGACPIVYCIPLLLSLL